MIMRQIITHPNPILRRRSTEIETDFLNSEDFFSLVKDMKTVLRGYHGDGIGLAAPQIGENLRVIVIDKAAVPGKKQDLILINPKWVKTSRKQTIDTEGCLSIPLTFGKVKRCKNIQVTALNEKGQPVSFSADDLLARVVQHEIDHLDGVLFIDKASDIFTNED